MKNDYANGITLIEICVVLAILSIFATFAIPSFNHLLQKYRYKTTVNRLVNDLKFAKNYASQSQSRISMCNTADGKSCQEKSPYDWRKGWIIFIDNEGAFRPTSDNLIRYTQILTPPHELMIQSNPNIANGINFNRYRRYGKTKGTGLPNGSYYLCAKGQMTFLVIVNVFGITRYEERETSC